MGHVVKMLVKFLRREIVRCMVKLNDLEDLVEPPMGRNSSVSTSYHPKDEADGLHDDAVVGAQFNPCKVNLDLV